MTKLDQAYSRGYEDGDAGRDFVNPYTRTENREMYAHGYFAGEYAFERRWQSFVAQHSQGRAA